MRDHLLPMLFEVKLGNFTTIIPVANDGEPPGILQEVRRCYQKEDPWWHLFRKTRFGEWSSFAKASEDKRRVATSTFTEPIQFIINASEVLGSSKKNKRSILISCAVWYPEGTKVATD